ncbi:unnamed protein product [Rotaria sordida]|uniref:Uncharacterized protein n=1 Tax=Rotaria sordida TaxID=392033 RepID=A0A815GJI0_9BILA|nr:unnamed protein product [Rotaria sordida]CAF1339719.1 unnamed protein product [Rotaria sordida]
MDHIGQQQHDLLRRDLVKEISEYLLLTQFRIRFETPVNIDILFDNHSQLSIDFIQINSQLYSSTRIYSSLERSSQSFYQKKGLVDKNASDDYSRICNINQYSSSIHRIHFRIDERINTCLFLANGWCDSDYAIVNGKSLSTCILNKTIQSDDDVILILDYYT